MTTPNHLPSVGTDDARRVWLFTLYADAELRDSDNNALAIFPAHRMDEARRVVACWNALKGVPTKEIEGGLIHGKALKDVVSERDELASRVRGLEGALRVARDNVADWGGYIGSYFQEKHDLAGDLAAIDAALNASNNKEQP